MPGRTSRQRLLLRIALYGGALFVGLPAAFAFIMTRPCRLPVSSTAPLRYEEVALTSDGLRLRAWLARGDRGRPAVIIVHGLGDHLESYREHAQLFLDQGNTVLLPDLRGHGGSEGTYTTLGGRESEDVRAGMQYLKVEGLADKGFVLMGHSMEEVELTWADRIHEKGREAGVIEGKRDALLKLLTAKFGSLPAETTLTVKDIVAVATLDAFLERAATSTTLEEVGL